MGLTHRIMVPGVGDTAPSDGRLGALAPAQEPPSTAYCLLPAAYSWCFVALTMVVLAVTAYGYLAGMWGYVDNGDGYYLYAAQRLAHGAVLYHQVLGTQPPVVYALGALAFKIGGFAGARLLSVLMRVAATVLVYACGRHLFADRLVAAPAALLYTLLPIGFYWDRSFDVNPPLVLAALLSLLPLLSWTPRGARLSGVMAALALFTKDLYIPLLVATLAYLLLLQRRLLWPYLQGLLVALAIFALLLLSYAGAQGLHDAFLGQDASPLNVDWFTGSLRYVASLEGGLIVVALAGLAWCRARSYLPWLLAGSSAVLLATLKEGTFGAVFQLAEPAVALLAAHALIRASALLSSQRSMALDAPGGPAPLPAGSRWSQNVMLRQTTGKPTATDLSAVSPGARGRWRSWRPTAVVAPAVLSIAAVSIALCIVTNDTALRADTAPDVARVVSLVRAHAAPGSTIVAPPYYAVRGGDLLPGDAADTYILAQRVRRGDPAARRWLHEVTTALAARRLPIVLIDLRLAQIAPLMAALRATYHPVYDDTLSPALHVEAWLPGRV